MKISLIVAMDRNRVIGRDGGMPWHLPDDLKRFKRITLGKPIVMGRKTHESIGKPLPGRRNLVISRNADYVAEGCEVYPSLEAALDAVADAEEAVIIGGEQLYAAGLERADRLYLTRIDAGLEGDTWFPEFDEAEWELVESGEHPADARHDYAFLFEMRERFRGSEL